jgi:hypothetical protein
METGGSNGEFDAIVLEEISFVFRASNDIVAQELKRQIEQNVASMGGEIKELVIERHIGEAPSIYVTIYPGDYLYLKFIGVLAGMI